MTLCFLPESMSTADSAVQKGKAKENEGEIERKTERERELKILHPLRLNLGAMRTDACSLIKYSYRCTKTCTYREIER